MMQGDLVHRAQSGDHEAFDALAGAAYDRLSALAYRILRDSDRSQDAVQERLVHAWRDIRGLRDLSRFDAWLHRLLVNACYDESRRRRQRSVEIHLLSFDRAAPGDAARDIADRDQLERGFRRLPIEQRAVLVMHHYLGMRLPEIAETLGSLLVITSTAVPSRCASRRRGSQVTWQPRAVPLPPAQPIP